jgi:RND family efflux transporter MFP subunit
MKKSILVISIAAIVSTGGAFALYSAKPSAAQKPAAPVASVTVGVTTPEITSFSRVVAATGTISARDELVIGSDASGVRLLEVLVDVGTSVKKGQLLARADDSQLQAQLAQQQAQVKNAQAENAQAQANRERAERLTDFFSIETVQTRRTAAATAAARLDLAMAQLAELQVKVAQTRVHAPSAGVISRKSATVGAVVQPGSELFRMIRGGELEWRAELPSHSLAQIQAGAVARIMLDNGDWLHSTVRLVAPTMDSATRNGWVYVSLPPSTSLKAGAYARGEILIEQAEGLSVGETSVVTRDGNAFVFTINEESIAQLTPVVPGTRQRGRVEIRAGLRVQDRIVGTGAGFVKDGDVVRVVINSGGNS